MNRLQKKCVIATVGIHLLLLTILIVGPAFFNPQSKPDDTQLLKVIPANLIDAAFNSGVRDATPPAPAPVVVPPTPAVQPTPPPPAPKPVVPPPPTLMDRVEKYFKPEPKPEPIKPAPEKTETRPHKIQVNTQLVARAASRNPTPDNSRQTPRLSQNDIRKLKEKLSQTTEVTMPGESSESYASYRDALAPIYYNAWTTPSGATGDEADAIVKITVAADGTVINARIITPSGDEKMDDSVRRALDRVPSVPPLPDKTKSEQDFTIDFNLKAKRLLE